MKLEAEAQGHTDLIRPTIWLVHGFNVRDGGKGTVGKLIDPIRRHLPNFNIQLVSYGWVFFFSVRWSIRKHARRLAELSSRIGSSRDIWVGHSHGCNLINEATFDGLDAKRLVFVNPALDKDTPISATVEKLDVYHAPGDLAVEASAILPWHRWGNMGSRGYQGPLPFVKNFNMMEMWPRPEVPWRWWAKHSKIFTRPDLLARHAFGETPGKK